MQLPTEPVALARLIWSWLIWIVGVAITVMIVAHVAGRYGYRVPYVPNGGSAMDLAAPAVAYWAAPKG